MYQKVKILNPFEINIDPMKRLLLVNFEKDPDSIYKGFEPQVFDDAEHGKGHLVIGWRIDNKVDVYHEPSLRLNPGTYDIAGKGLENMINVKMEKAHYEIDNAGVQAFYLFNDSSNREVLISINEKNPKKRKPFGLLAPMGDAAEHPSAMPLVFLHDFYFVRKNYTEIEISIEGKQHQPDELPLPMDLSKMYFTRYSPQPLIATLNPAHNGTISLIEITSGAEKFSREDYDFDLKWIDQQPFIKRIIRKNEVHSVTLDFKDPFPNIHFLENNKRVKGKFTIEAHPSTGYIKGKYILEKKDNHTTIYMIPSKGWKPRSTKISLYLLYKVAKIFKKWPSTYEWRGNIYRENEELYNMVSGWKRVNRK